MAGAVSENYSLSFSPILPAYSQELSVFRSLLSDQLRKQGELLIAHDERRELEDILARSSESDDDELLKTELNRKITRYWVLELELYVLKQACALQLCSMSKKLGWNLQLQNKDGELHSEGIMARAERADTKNLRMQLEMKEEKIEQALKDCSMPTADIAQLEQENVAMKENFEASVSKNELREKEMLEQQTQKTEQEVKCLSSIETATNMDYSPNSVMDVECRSVSVEAEAERKVRTFRKAMKILGHKLAQQRNELARAKRLITIFRAKSKCSSRGSKKVSIADRTAIVNSTSISSITPVARAKSPSQRRNNDFTSDNHHRSPKAPNETTAIEHRVSLNPNSDVFYPQQYSHKCNPRSPSYAMAEMSNYGIAAPAPSSIRPKNRYTNRGQRRHGSQRHHDKLQQQQQQQHHQQQQQQQERFTKIRRT